MTFCKVRKIFSRYMVCKAIIGCMVLCWVGVECHIFDFGVHQVLQDSVGVSNISERCRVRFNDLFDLEQPENLACRFLNLCKNIAIITETSS